jgi:hypothetical protein
MITRHRPSLALSYLAIAALMLGVAACSSAGSPPTSGTTSPPLTDGPLDGATLHGEIYISGQMHNKPTTWHETKMFTETVPTVSDCADFAKSGMSDGIFRVPSPDAPLPEANIEVAGFRGPGTYPPAVMKRDKSDSIVVGQDSGTQSGRYVITAPARGITQGKEVLFLNPNGSGQLVYSEAHLNGKASEPAVAGLISWTCTS